MRIHHPNLHSERCLINNVPSSDLKTVSTHRIQTADLNATQVLGRIDASDLNPVNIIRALKTSSYLDTVY